MQKRALAEPIGFCLNVVQENLFLSVGNPPDYPVSKTMQRIQMPKARAIFADSDDLP